MPTTLWYAVSAMLATTIGTETVNTTHPLPRYTPATRPPKMVLTDRDIALLTFIYDYNGVVTKDHLQRRFWPHTQRRAMTTRLSRLFHNRYISWPTPEQRVNYTIPQTVVWLNWQGILVIARQQGLDIPPPTNESEWQLRQLYKRLRQHGLRWRRLPLNTLRHDLLGIDIRLKFEHDAHQLPHLSIPIWHNQGVFKLETDLITYSLPQPKKQPDTETKPKTTTAGVEPDDFCIVANHKQQIQNQPQQRRFLFEYDLSTHSHRGTWRDKAAAMSAYVKSPAYKARFGYNSGTWLVVAKTQERIDNLIHTVATYAEAPRTLWRFTTFSEAFNSPNLLTAPIWQQPSYDRQARRWQGKPQPLFSL
ncbi:MAG: hypothetical protein KC415_05570 [Anaerolineales bacterium]|nr:hypothetical protein [Anaerolineales bacterium]